MKYWQKVLATVIVTVVALAALGIFGGQWLREYEDGEHSIGSLELGNGQRITLYADNVSDVVQGFYYAIGTPSEPGEMNFFLSIAGGDFELRASHFSLLSAQGVYGLVDKREPQVVMMLYEPASGINWPGSRYGENYQPPDARIQNLLRRLRTKPEYASLRFRH